MEIKPFDIVIVSGKTVFSWGIKKFTKSNFSHAGLMLTPYLMLESDARLKTTIRPLTYESDSIQVYRYTGELTDEQKQLMLDYMYQHLNSGYDWLYLITRGLNILFNTPVFQNRNKHTCDEIIFDMYNVAGVKLIDDKTYLIPSSFSLSPVLRRVL